MRKATYPPIKLISLFEDDVQAWAHPGLSRIEELEAMARTITRLREVLIDHSPMLALSAEALEKAVALEIASQRVMRGP